MDYQKRDFLFRDDPEPHLTFRRKQILKAHPEISKLFGPTSLTKYIVLATVCLQVYLSSIAINLPWIQYLTLAYVVGATANHSLFLAIHELSHNLGSKYTLENKLLAMLANLPICVPYCVTFRPYHMEHHTNQGLHHVDTDIPSYLEGYLITTTATGYFDHCLRKFIFMFIQIFGYALRPILIKPDLMPYNGWLVLNYIIQIIFDLCMMHYFGIGAITYLLVSTFLAGSIHPTAGHFISEHYVVEGKYETYSYYGWLNCLAYNVGYHNEHHDFPNIAWPNLPKVKAIAPEFYDNLPQTKSWPGTIINYIFNDKISPFSRVKQSCKKKQ